MIFKRFFSPKSDGDLCTLYADRTTINRRNVTADPAKAYRADRDFFLVVVQSRVIAAAMEILGIQSKSSQPSKCPIPPGVGNMSNQAKLQYLHKVAAMIVDSFVFDQSSVNHLVDKILTAQEKEDAINSQQLTEDGRFPCRFPGCNCSFQYDGRSRRRHELTHDPPPEVPTNQAEPSGDQPNSDDSVATQQEVKSDDVYNYNCALLTDGLFFMNFLDAIAEGDGGRMMRQYKYLLLYCRADGTHSTKYALECLYQSFLVNAMLSPRDAERFVWNRTVNNSGKPGKNIALDLDVEHSNNFVKQAIKHLGPNLTEDAVSRICKAENSARTVLENIDHSICRAAGSSEHSQRTLERDLSVLVDKCLSNSGFEKHNSRSYVCFRGFERDPFRSLDMSSMFKWINKHKKNMQSGLRAR